MGEKFAELKAIRYRYPAEGPQAGVRSLDRHYGCGSRYAFLTR
jgi:hypothetical protein